VFYGIMPFAIQLYFVVMSDTTFPHRHSPKQARLACLFATSGHSGVDRIMKNLIPSIASRGIGVDLLHVRKHGPYLDNVPDNVRVIDLGVSNTVPAFFPVMRYLRKNKPDVLLSDKDKVNRLAYLATKFTGVDTRLVFRMGTTVSNDLATCGKFKQWTHYRSMHHLYPKVSTVIVPSLGVANDMAEFAKISVDDITVVHNPIVTPSFLEKMKDSTDHPWFGQTDIPVILGVGELTRRKGFDVLLKAFAQTLAQRPCRLVILGKGKALSELTSLSESLGITDFVDFLGFQDNPSKYMKAAELFVSASTHEGFGNVIVEAMAAGTPVVATDCPSGPREILKDGRLGRLVPVNDVDAMAQAITHMLIDPTPQDVLADAMHEYHIDTITDQYLAALGIHY